MGIQRNGARTFLTILNHACKLSHMPGFVAAIGRILGPEKGAELLTVWQAVCNVVELAVASDNWFNQLDFVNDDTTGEDIAGVPA